MEISIARAGAWSVVRASGDIDLHCSQQFRGEVLAQIDGGSQVLLDLGEVSYLDSSGVAALAQALARSRERGLSLGLVRPTDAVMRILRLTKLDSVFPIFDSVEKAPGA